MARRRLLITAVTEHKAVLDTCKRLEKYGYRVTYLPVQKDGLVDLDDLKRAIAWIRKHGVEYGANPDFLVITGGSAGVMRRATTMCAP